MSINWVMLSDTEGFTPLPEERRIFTSPPRTVLSLQTLNKFPGKEPFSIQSQAGTAYVTNRRILYLPAKPTATFQSFTAPLLNFHDTHVTAPFFGPNQWCAVVQPVPGGGIPPQHQAVEIKMTFKDGGAFDFHTSFERVKERLMQAVDTARESAQSASSGGEEAGAYQGVDFNNVNLDELPAYEERGAGLVMPAAQTIQTQPSESPRFTEEQRNPNIVAPVARRVHQRSSTSSTEQYTPPSDPPPGYEEAQRDGIADELERRLRNDSQR